MSSQGVLRRPSNEPLRKSLILMHAYLQVHGHARGLKGVSRGGRGNVERRSRRIFLSSLFRDLFSSPPRTPRETVSVRIVTIIATADVHHPSNDAPRAVLELRMTGGREATRTSSVVPRTSFTLALSATRLRT